ncbi:MAG: hypothetical protein K2H85_10420, partial [Allobaculum sp.]|nr:hypothetical protein [Allobaculum sp.]
MAERIILNPSTSSQNVVNRKELEKMTKLTMRQLTKQLLDVSGPYSRNDFILQDVNALYSGTNTDIVNGRKAAKQEFTRDGIKTLKAVDYASPIQRYLKEEVLTWVGERIDTMCHDGTTTSMLFTASFLMY